MTLLVALLVAAVRFQRASKANGNCMSRLYTLFAAWLPFALLLAPFAAAALWHLIRWGGADAG